MSYCAEPHLVFITKLLKEDLRSIYICYQASVNNKSLTKGQGIRYKNLDSRHTCVYLLLVVCLDLGNLSLLCVCVCVCVCEINRDESKFVSMCGVSLFV
jgi:hypothetical protein